MVVPANSWIGAINKKWWHWKVNVPQGMYTLEEYRGRNNGLMEIGPHWCYCSCKGVNRQIKAQISQNTIRFKTFISSIPTKDKVLVAVEVGINFRIGISPETAESDCIKFVYNFGPNRLEELLQEEIDEEMRNFICQIKVMRLRDVKTEMCEHVKVNLQEKFRAYGVCIEQVNVMSTMLPIDLRHILKYTTQFDVMLQQQVKQ